MLYDDAMNSKQLIEFMRRLIKDADHKLILILDNLKVHHSKPVKGWRSKNADKIEVFYLPAYSPELNPDEYLNNDLKQAVHGNYGGVARSKAAIHEKTISHMRHLQKSPRVCLITRVFAMRVIDTFNGRSNNFLNKLKQAVGYVPERLQVDNGSEFISKELDRRV